MRIDISFLFATNFLIRSWVAMISNSVVGRSIQSELDSRLVSVNFQHVFSMYVDLEIDLGPWKLNRIFYQGDVEKNSAKVLENEPLLLFAPFTHNIIINYL